MKVNFSTNSWHYKLQKFVYGREPTLEFNLCPYFWKTVIALFFLPLALIGYSIRSCVEIKSDNYYFGSFDSNLTYGFKITFNASMIAFFIVSLGMLAFMFIQLLIGSAIFAGLFLIVCVLAIGILALGFTVDFWWPYLQAVKNKVCPIIYWNEKE